MATPPTPAQVNTSVADALDFVDFLPAASGGQNTDGSFGGNTCGSGVGDVPETAAAIIAYGVLDKGNIANLPTAAVDPAPPHSTHNFQTDLTNAVTWLLSQQDTTDPKTSEGLGGAWGFCGLTDSNSDSTYSTGLALAALSLSATVPTTPATAVATAIANGRTFLENEFQGPPNETCTTAGADPNSAFCGGWNYAAADLGRSDESNSGFAMTGLALTGGVPAAIQLLNAGWNNNSQADTTSNSTYSSTHNDGGGSYQPAYVQFTGNDFSSNANDSGSMTFSFADDALTTADPRVQAALQFDTDVLDTYEKAAHSGVSVKHVMVYHNGASEDGSCDPSAGGCDWAFGSGEGGFHYSMFSLSKGLGGFIPPKLSDGTNWYAKLADLLLNQQATNATLASFGSWPPDLRDDYSPLFATGLSVFALGLVGVPPAPTTSVLQSSTNPSASGQPVTFTDTVCGATPTGSVTFADGGTTLGTGALAPGGGSGCSQATFTTSSLAVGSHSITATYSGDSKNAASSAALTQTVTGVPVPLAGASDGTSSLWGLLLVGAGTPLLLIAVRPRRSRRT